MLFRHINPVADKELHRLREGLAVVLGGLIEVANFSCKTLILNIVSRRYSINLLIMNELNIKI